MNYPARILEAHERPNVPQLWWADFVRQFNWKQGEHVALIGPTGSGKTTLAQYLTQLRDYVTIFGTKPSDETLDHFANNYGQHRKSWLNSSMVKGYVVWSEWKPALGRRAERMAERYPHRIIWPHARSIYAPDTQKRVFLKALDNIFQQGDWCLFIDELWYMANVLDLDKYVKLYLLQARALGISLLEATQRPAWIPLEVYDQSTHLFFWRDNDEQNLKRISGIGWQSASVLRYEIAHLMLHEVLYVNTRTGQLLKTMAPWKGGK